MAHHGMYEDPARTLSRDEERRARHERNKVEDRKAEAAWARSRRRSI